MGGSLVFPGNRVGSAQTIIQVRGMSRASEDRIDLTLECIRLHYARKLSPSLPCLTGRRRSCTRSRARCQVPD
ncbi:DUF6994 family protein [Rathayibacter iranicus]|uniref:DUF6994 family protein n=1 Tax=Rathayibacter iranicus TaxID=59737 RepID=UPI003B0280E1